MGNGDIGVVAGDPLISQQSFWLGKSDFWGTHWNARHNAPEVSILSLGRLTISSPGEGAIEKRVSQVDQDILHARVRHNVEEVANTTVHLLFMDCRQPKHISYRDRLRAKKAALFPFKSHWKCLRLIHRYAPTFQSQ